MHASKIVIIYIEQGRFLPLRRSGAICLSVINTPHMAARLLAGLSGLAVPAAAMLASSFPCVLCEVQTGRATSFAARTPQWRRECRIWCGATTSCAPFAAAQGTLPGIHQHSVGGAYRAT